MSPKLWKVFGEFEGVFIEFEMVRIRAVEMVSGPTPGTVDKIAAELSRSCPTKLYPAHRVPLRHPQRRIVVV